MSGGAFVTIKVGRSGTAGDHTRYITRERATEGKQERVWTQNIPEYADHPDHAEQGMSYKERTGDLREYARQLEEDELERPQRGAGEKRTHYRAIYSFDREVTDEKAREMVDAHLAENFPKARAIAAIHRDTDNAHVHVNIAARGTDDKKLHFNKQTHRQLDERWARIYGQEFGREIEKEHLEKKQQWRDWMREARAAKERGEVPPPRPKRISRERNQVQERREMHAKQYGLNHANQTGIRDDQRRATNGEQPATAREQRAGATPRGTDRELAGSHNTA
ncbi:MAG: relaxase/mobilization nuclease domain-containing protein, partial [Pyrinomonadaceae bacterium]